MNPVSKPPRDAQLVVLVNNTNYKTAVCCYSGASKRYVNGDGSYPASDFTHWTPYPLRNPGLFDNQEEEKQ